MSLERDLFKIKKFFIKRYEKNLASILIFGSANTGQFIKGKYDIDAIVLLKEEKSINFEEEKELLLNIFGNENFRILHFMTLHDYKKHIYQKGSWSSWITAIEGSTKLYATAEFKEFRSYLISHQIPGDKLIEYLNHKDEFELEGYFKDINNLEKTRGLFSHLRRKLQILNYYQTEKIIFNYYDCLINLNFKGEEKLNALYKNYVKRKELSSKEIKDYYEIAKELTMEIEKVLNEQK